MKFASVVGRLESGAHNAWAIHDRAQARRAAGEDIVFLSVGDPDFDSPEAVVAAAVDSLARGRTKYAAFAGEPALRRAIADHHYRVNGERVSPQQVVVFPGAQNALYTVARCILDAGDEVLLPEPRYVTYEMVLATCGAMAVDVPLAPERGFHLDPRELESRIGPATRLIVLNTPHNPTGMVMSREEVEAVAEIARRHDLWVVVDEVYAELVYGAEHVSARALPGMADRAVSIGSLSKSHAMQGWRVGWTVASPELTAHLINYVKPMHYGMSPFVQDAAAAALSGNLPEVERMRAEYQARRDLICARINAVPGLSCHWPEGSMFLLVDVREFGLDDTAFAYGLLEHGGVSVLPAGAFGPSAAGHVRVSLSASVEVLRDACDRIERYARHLALEENCQ